VYPILSVSKDEKSLKKQIKATLYHEIGHHFGMSEKEIQTAQNSRDFDSSTGT
jgi:predicted Zn-dependent protease with MMP-like domain